MSAKTGAIISGQEGGRGGGGGGGGGKLFTWVHVHACMYQ